MAMTLDELKELGASLGYDVSGYESRDIAMMRLLQASPDIHNV